MEFTTRTTDEQRTALCGRQVFWRFLAAHQGACRECVARQQRQQELE